MSTNETKLQDVIQTSLQNIKTLIDTNTIIGTPINHPSGTVIIPVSKVAMAYATGGLDCVGKTDPNAKPQNFGAGGGTGLTLQPIGFLVVNPAGEVEMINVGVKNPSDPIEQIADLIERSPEIIGRIKAILTKDEA
jgi:sporulation protein YtfJ